MTDVDDRPDDPEKPERELPPARPAWPPLLPAARGTGDYGWPTGSDPPEAADGPPAPPPPVGSEARQPELGAAPPPFSHGAPTAPRPLPRETRPHRHSRNPVDRLTRNLPHPLRVTIDWVVTIVGAVAIVLLVKAYVVNPYRIPSSSMEPTLHCARPAAGCESRFSDRVLANRFLYRLRDPRRGEIIVFRTPPKAQVQCGAGGTFVKRLIGLPGDTIQVKLRAGSAYVFINGKPLDEPYIQKQRRGSQTLKPVKIAADQYFMMGDNRSQSCDSRMWGTVPRKNLIGKVFATYWPPNRISLH